MEQRTLHDLTVSAVGMGCMAFSHGYGQIPSEEYSVEAIRGAYDHGCTFFDTAEVYSPGLSGIGHNEKIVGKALSDVREKVVLGTKLFLTREEARRDGSVYAAARRHLEASLERLQTDWVDLYYLHRTGDIPVEEVAEAMRQLIEDGLIHGWGLSQVDVDVIDRAQRVTPLTAIQNIYSMVERDMEQAVIPYCLEHNIGVVPFSPIASGLLSGKITVDTQFERHDDVRNWVPQLSRQNIAGNQPIVDVLRDFAARKSATPAQISLAWMLHKYPNVVPIPGSKNKGRILENLDAAQVELTGEEFQQLETALDRCKVYGHRGFTSLR
ncbi:aldo/keto reductase [Intestinimonas butyriciproducens]|uniref:aldo/keto reductase n=1 Tax=Intestinimonas butyriciproducens TaxID=1297617 RepID=UPI001957D150|nr:aldo/keto reductase [Intestinimonas butyriciproducens]MBM6975969.1 aldo/keto reductase [Intestinimonas butyriciproducens]